VNHEGERRKTLLIYRDGGKRENYQRAPGGGGNHRGFFRTEIECKKGQRGARGEKPSPVNKRAEKRSLLANRSSKD